MQPAVLVAEGQCETEPLGFWTWGSGSSRSGALVVTGLAIRTAQAGGRRRYWNKAQRTWDMQRTVAVQGWNPAGGRKGLVPNGVKDEPPARHLNLVVSRTCCDPVNPGIGPVRNAANGTPGER